MEKLEAREEVLELSLENKKALLQKDKVYVSAQNEKQELADIQVELAMMYVEEITDSSNAGEVADLWQALNSNVTELSGISHRSAESKTLSGIAEALKVMQLKVLSLCKHQKLQGFKGESGSVTYKKEIVGNIENFEKLVRYVVKYDRFELLTRKVNNKPFRDLIADKIAVEGVNIFETQKVSCKKIM